MGQAMSTRDGVRFALIRFSSIKSIVCCHRAKPQAGCGIPSDFADEHHLIMKIHEYQAKAILKKYGVSVPRGAMAATRDEAETIAKNLFDDGATGVVLKAL